jgi:hypothetical protein
MIPVWETQSGNLGTVPEQIFFQVPLQANTAFYPTPSLCSATAAGSNIITCDTTVDATPGRAVRFFGTTFGNIQENTVYYVLQKINATQFTVSISPDSNDPVTLTSATGVMTARFSERVYFRLQSGDLPAGIQITGSGQIIGVPSPISLLQGVPVNVDRDVTNRFTVRAYTVTTINGQQVIDGIADRTFSLTVTGNDVPSWITPAGSLGTYLDGDEVDIQLDYDDNDASDTVIVRLVSGQIPLGLTLSTGGAITGYIKPFPDETQPVGYDLTPIGTVPYDFLTAAISKNYQFTLELTDGKSSTLRTFTIFVYNRQDLTGDDTYITSDSDFITADLTPERAPFLLNAAPSDIGTIRGDNYFAYRFVGEDYDTELLEYAISVNEGFGLPPGLELDPYSGWFYGFVPDVGVTSTEYSFFIQVRNRSLVCTATDATTDTITCDQNTRADFFVGAEITFERTVFGGISANTTYYVAEIVSDTAFKISETFSGPVFSLTTATGSMFCVPEFISKSQLYPFTLTVTGAIDREVIWLTDSDLGTIDNGAVSILRIEAENRGGAELFYELESGAFNELPQGLTLLPSGEIAGRVTFNTFAIDLGTTTFDKTNTEFTDTSETTFDSTFTFVANAYAEDPQQELFKVSAVRVISGGTGYSSPPSITFNTPVGADAIQASATAIVVGGSINRVVVTNSGAAYTAPATISVTGVGSGAVLEVVMQPTGIRRVISSNQNFSVRVNRVYNKPYQNLYIVAMPPDNDRDLINGLLADDSIFVPSYIFRPDDPNFGVASNITYLHAVGLAPEPLQTYVDSLNLNHYWKNLILGSISTAQAVDANGDVIYEVVYSNIIDDLVNNQGQSVSKIVNLPYTITDPVTGEPVQVVYPNSLVNMRDQVIDSVGQISTTLPLWMTSKQTNGTVLGFQPAWVLCYTRPGRSEQIAYYINRYFGENLNQVDFKVDRYVIDSQLSRNWNTATQNWTPEPSLTTFDRISTTGFTDLGRVQVCTELAYADVHLRTLDSINALGGLDGPTWIAGTPAPSGTRVIITNGSKLIFVKQELFSGYPTSDLAFTRNIGTFDEGDVIGGPGSFDFGTVSGGSESFDYGVQVPGGTQSFCTESVASTDVILCGSTLGLYPGDKIYFTGSTFGGIEDVDGLGLTQVYYAHAISSVLATSTSSVTNEITVTSAADISVDDEIWFPGSGIGGLASIFDNGLSRPYYVVAKPTGTSIQVSTTVGGTPIGLSDEIVSPGVTINLPSFQISLDPTDTLPVTLIDATGSMTLNYNNDRMAIYTISVNNNIISLTLDSQTVVNDYVESTQGAKYPGGTLLYRTGSAAQGLILVNWQPLLSAVTVVSDETIFDGGSMQFVEPIDIYDPTDEYDKYIVFPKQNILV